MKSKSKLESLQGLTIECQRRRSFFLSLSLSLYTLLVASHFHVFVVVPPALFCSSAPMSPYYYKMIFWFMFMSCLWQNRLVAVSRITVPLLAIKAVAIKEWIVLIATWKN